MMELFKKFLPEKAIEGKIGYYPVMNDEEWEKLPAVYKAMEWFPVEVYNTALKRNETTVVEYVYFDMFLTTYQMSVKVRVHRQEVPKLLFRSYRDNECLFYTICDVEFANGQRLPAKWLQDSRTGAFGVFCGKCVGKQGGFQGYVPSNIEETEDGFKYKGYVPREQAKGITHYCHR